MKIIALTVIIVLFFSAVSAGYAVFSSDLPHMDKQIALQMLDGAFIRIGIAGIIAAILAKK